MDEVAGPKVVVYGEPEPSAVVLSDVEVRVLGSLVEKRTTTPDYYPLTLNALVNACNQTSSRDPIVTYDESTVVRALERLRDAKLAYVFSGAESRTLKYGEKFAERLHLAPSETAVLCVLLLRGAQTVGEIRTRTARLHEFASLAEVETTLDSLAAKAPQPLVARLPRQSGFKESRFAHLLSGAPVGPTETKAAGQPVPNEADRVAALQQEVSALREELADLRGQFAQFKKQFE